LSLKNLIGRMQKAGVTDFTAEGKFEGVSRRGNAEEIKEEEKTLEREKRIGRKKQAIRKGIDPKTVV
jgi:hypothetical protein